MRASVPRMRTCRKCSSASGAGATRICASAATRWASRSTSSTARVRTSGDASRSALDALEPLGDLEPLRLEAREHPRELALPRERRDEALLRVVGVRVARREPRVERRLLLAEPCEVLLDGRLTREQRLARVGALLPRFRLFALLRAPHARAARCIGRRIA